MPSPIWGKAFIVVCFGQAAKPYCHVDARNTRPRGTPILIGAGWRSQAKGKKEESLGRSLLQTERFKFFPATELYSNPAFQFNSSSFSVAHRFFVTFLVRPQPPTAAL